MSNSARCGTCREDRDRCDGFVFDLSLADGTTLQGVRLMGAGGVHGSGFASQANRGDTVDLERCAATLLRQVSGEAEARGFRVFDATCPLVSKVHVEVAKLHREGYEFIMIGHKGHPEVEGTMGQLLDGIYLVEDAADVAHVTPKQTERLAVVTQTTLSVDDAAHITAAVVARFPNIRKPKVQDICYATQNRQDAVKVLSPQVDLVIVVGSPTSSNSNRLRDVAERSGVPSYMVDNANELQEVWFADKTCVGLTAGASAPDILVQQVIARMRALGAVSVRTLDGVEETIKFPLPKGLK